LLVKVLVTGAGGFIGRNLAEGLRERHEIAAPGREELDLLDEESVHCYLRRHRFEAIVHSATVRASRRIGAPAGLLHDNCRMFFNLARNQDCFGRLLFLSSGAVYDRQHAAPMVTEEHFGLRVPADEYGFSKYICGQFVPFMENACDLRLFGVFGPHEDWEIRFLSNACCRAAFGLPIVIRQNVYFDYLDVADLVQAVDALLGATPRHRAYNVCRGQAVDLETLAAKVVRASGKDLRVAIREPGLGAEYSGDNSRLREEFPGLRFRDLDNSIARLYGWYLENQASIDPARLSFDA
jgi:GDP-L-fucose synthase